MDYVTLALVGLLLLVIGFFCGSQYRKGRVAGMGRVQALKSVVNL